MSSFPFSGVDETRTCKNCNEPFPFTVKEQEWMAEKNFDKPPNKCKKCRKEARDARQGGQPNQGGYNNTGGYNASGYNQNNRQPAPLTEQRVYPSDYRDSTAIVDDEPRRNGRGRRNRRGREEDNGGDW